MRSQYSLLFLCIVILTAGCSAYSTTTPVVPPPQATVDTSPMAPVPAGLNPVETARRLLDAAYPPVWLDGPTPALVQQMTFADARKVMPVLSEEAEQVWGRQTSVWLVIFKGRWQLLPYGQTQGPPAPTIYDGCLLVLFRASDGSPIANGDTVCPGQ